jgi:alpha-D-ribose 1-methylphosphonate 5-triphosphate synthase subunit PhnL
MTSMIRAESLSKTFTLHLQGGTRLPVLQDISLTVDAGECVILGGPSGVGKSTLLRLLYGNYRPSGGRVLLRQGDGWIDLAQSEPREILDLRRRTVGYVSQFLRVIPRVPALDLVAEPLAAVGVDAISARARAANLLAALDIPERLWSLPPATFSGGEQQRINIARGLIAEHPILLLDEPTAALDAANRGKVVQLIRQATARGAAVAGIFHDAEVRDAVGTRIFALERLEAAA